MKTSVFPVAARATTLLAVLCGSVHGASLIVNGSFEQSSGAVHGEILESGSTVVTGWTVVDNIPSTIAHANTLYMSEGYLGNPAGHGSAFLWIDNNNSLGPTDNGIYQDFTTEAGQLYMVAFQAATEVAYGDPGLLRVSAGDTTADFTLPNLGGYPENPVFAGWASYSFTFTATSATTRLQFFDRGLQIGGDPTNGNASPLIDDVSVTAVPEPSSALIAGAFLWLASIRGRRALGR